MNFHKVEIESIIRETKDAVSFTFKKPEQQENSFSYISGQYVPLKFINNDKEEITRYYSFSSSPFESYLKFTIKRVDNGSVSNFVNDKLTLNSVIEIGEPSGEFVLQNQKISDSYLLIAGGSGITPILSIVNQELHNNLTSKFVLIYTNRSKEQIIFFEKLQELQKKFSSRLFIEYYVKEEEYDWANNGRLEKSDLKYFISDKYADLKFDSYYICGSKKLNDFTLESLSELNIEKEKIFFELFFVGDNENVESNILKEVEVSIPSQNRNVKVNGHNNLLDELLSTGIEIEHSCKSGLCKSCICQVVEGETEIIENFILSEKEVENNHRLLCLTKAKSDSITIKFEE